MLECVSLKVKFNDNNDKYFHTRDISIIELYNNSYCRFINNNANTLFKILDFLKNVLSENKILIVNKGKNFLKWLKYKGVNIPNKIIDLDLLNTINNYSNHLENKLERNNKKDIRNLSNLFNDFENNNEINVKDYINIKDSLINSINNTYERLEKYSYGCIKKYNNHWSGLKYFIPMIEVEFYRNLIEIEYAGVPVNREYLENLLKDYNKSINKITLEIAKNYNIKNPNSPKQVLEYLNKQGYNINSTDKTVLKDINTDFTNSILELKSLHAKKGLIEGYLNIYNERLYPTFNQIMNTGRLSCENPNVQQIPRDIKDNFYKGNIIKIDYPCLELRILASYMKKLYNDDTLVNLFKIPDIDLHTKTASLLFNKKEEEVSKQERQFAKGCNFGLSFGMGASRFKEYLTNYGINNISEEEAQNLKNKFLSIYPIIKKWHDDTMIKSNDVKNSKSDDTSLESEFVSLFTLGGRIVTPSKFNEMLNFPIQGTGADIVKYAVNGFYKLLEKNNLKDCANIVNIVHDEIVVEIKEEGCEKEIKNILKQSMELSIDYILNYFHTEIE